MRRIHPGLALVSLVAVAGMAAGCTRSATSPGASAAPSSAPASSAQAALGAKARLLAGVTALTRTTSAFTVTLSGPALATAGGTTTMTGGLDPVGKAAAVDTKITAAGSTLQLSYILRSDAMYLKLVGVPGLTNKWMKIDPAKLPATQRAMFSAGADPTGVASTVQGVVDATETTPGTITGTIDLSKAAGSLAFSRDRIAELAPADRVVPYTATLDGQGRLTDLTLTMKVSGQDLKSETVYHDFGAPVAADAPPAADVTEASDLIYQILGSMN